MLIIEVIKIRSNRHFYLDRLLYCQQLLHPNFINYCSSLTVQNMIIIIIIIIITIIIIIIIIIMKTYFYFSKQFRQDNVKVTVKKKLEQNSSVLKEFSKRAHISLF